MKHLEVELPDRWVRFARSSTSVVVTALTCLALSFGPIFLFMLGKEGASFNDPRVIIVLMSIFLIPLIYIRLASLIIHQVRRGGEGLGSGPSRGMLTSFLLWSLMTSAMVAMYFWSRP